MAAMQKTAFVYILSSSFKHLYIGVTTNFGKRMRQHKEHAFPNSFTSRYRIDQLVYFEQWEDVGEAINREKQLKRWSRIKKIRLIVGSNPDWKDLSLEWGQPTEPFSGLLRPPTTFGSDK